MSDLAASMIITVLGPHTDTKSLCTIFLFTVVCTSIDFRIVRQWT